MTNHNIATKYPGFLWLADFDDMAPLPATDLYFTSTLLADTSAHECLGRLRYMLQKEGFGSLTVSAPSLVT